MKNIATTALSIAAGACFLAFLPAAHATPAAEGASAAAAPLSGLRLAGQGVQRFLGFDIYRARLWLDPSFDAEHYAAQPLALELTYHRSFTAEAIARRSIEEMRRVGSFSPQQAAQWRQALQAALPDVHAGDRLLGIHQPGVGAVFRMRGRVVGEVPDAEFSRLFFGIWLSPQTSEPALRQALIGAGRHGAPP